MATLVKEKHIIPISDSHITAECRGLSGQISCSWSAAKNSASLWKPTEGMLEWLGVCSLIWEGIYLFTFGIEYTQILIIFNRFVLLMNIWVWYLDNHEDHGERQYYFWLGTVFRKHPNSYGTLNINSQFFSSPCLL